MVGLSNDYLTRRNLQTVFLCLQIRSLDSQRFPEYPAGKLSEQTMLLVEATTRYCLGL